MVVATAAAVVVEVVAAAVVAAVDLFFRVLAEVRVVVATTVAMVLLF